MFGNPQTQVAFSVYENKGVFALLLGSGLSRAAEIPTGWEITLDLIRRVAALESVPEHSDWADWYRKNHDKEPDYSELLDALSSTPAERRQIIHSYIEPDEDDREEGRKRPTSGHKAIAQLVRDGFIRVIVTTNFDRLLENALREAGVEPTVVSSPDALKGAEPLAHTACYVLKLHGDYKDARILNTGEELGEYPAEYNVLLDRILDEYGLIVCGWSGEWDEALRSAILRAPNRRYPLFWASRGGLRDRAKELCASRKGIEVPISDADSFLSGLVEQVRTLAASRRQNPAEVDLLISRAKRYLAKDEHRIQFSDLISGELLRISGRLSEEDFSPDKPLTPDELVRRVSAYDSMGEGFVKLSGLVGRWGAELHLKIVGEAIRNLWVALRPVSGGFTNTLNIRGYIPVMACHAALISMVSAQRWRELHDFLNIETRNSGHSADTIICHDLISGRWEGNDKPLWGGFPGHANESSPFQNLMYEYFQENGDSFLSPLASYNQDFLLMEALIALASLEQYSVSGLTSQLSEDHQGRGYEWMPVYGRIGWDKWERKYTLEKFENPLFANEIVKAGFGKGSRETLEVYLEHLRRNIVNLRW